MVNERGILNNDITLSFNTRKTLEKSIDYYISVWNNARQLRTNGKL
ncbi:IS3 family transposase [Xenorhabdus cabanillasii]